MTFLMKPQDAMHGCEVILPLPFGREEILRPENNRDLCPQT